MAILLIISICFWLSNNLIAQNTQNFLGIYTLTEVCVSRTFPGYSDTIDYEIEITKSSIDTFDIQFLIDAHFQDTIRAIVLNDIAFQISLQIFQNFESTSISIWGEGFVQTDSIQIHYGSGGEIGLFECYCAGVRKKGNGSEGKKVLNSNHFLYPNPVKEILTVDLNKANDLNQNLLVLIFNAKGNLVLNERKRYLDKIAVDVSDLAPGTYVLSIKDGKNIEYSGFFIKN